MQCSPLAAHPDQVGYQLRLRLAFQIRQLRVENRQDGPVLWIFAVDPIGLFGVDGSEVLPAPSQRQSIAPK